MCNPMYVLKAELIQVMLTSILAAVSLFYIVWWNLIKKSINDPYQNKNYELIYFNINANCYFK